MDRSDSQQLESQLHSALRTQYESSELIGVNFAFFAPELVHPVAAAGFEDGDRTQPLAAGTGLLKSDN